MNEWDYDFGPNYVDHIYPWDDVYGLREVPNEEIIFTIGMSEQEWLDKIISDNMERYKDVLDKLADL